MRTLIVEGASVAYGMDAGDHGGWVAQLHRDRQTYNQQHRTVPETVVNRSLPGLTLPWFNRNFEGAIPPIDRMSRDGAVRILAVGINEAKIPQRHLRPTLSLGQFAVHLERYAEDSRMLAMPTIYVGSQPINDDRTRPVPATGFTIEDDLVEEYDELTKETAHTTGMPFVDVRELYSSHNLNDLLAEDGYHPNELGHRVIHAGVQSALATLGFSAVDR